MGLRAEVRADGQALPLWQRPGDGQLFVAGRHGQEFTIKVTNTSQWRYLIVPAIDHRAVLEDKPADVNGKGMIIPAHCDYTFSGWRQDNDTTRPFIFTFPERSVATQAAGPAAVTGVIGLAAYSEEVYVATSRARGYGYDERMTKGWSGQSYGAAVASAGPVERDLGTGIGAREDYSPVREGSFERAGMSLVKLLYASEDSLRAAGLMGPAEPPAFPEPKGFQDYKAV